MGEAKFFAVTTNAKQVLQAGKIGIRSIIWHNDDNAARFMQIFDKLTADVTIGTTVPDMVIQIAADTTSSFPFEDAVFQTGFIFAITTTRTGSTSGTASDVTIVVI